jgi:hypothetical protein
LHSRELRDFYAVNEIAILADSDKQSQLFYRIFPNQVDPGARRPRTLYWILDRTCDGSQYTAPRELIHLLSVARDVQLKQLELGKSGPSDEALFDGAALKGALPEVSRVRYEQTLCAEFPELRTYLRKLEGEKTSQTVPTLSKKWDLNEKEAAELANRLIEVGFFEQRGTRDEPQFWVPFLYRDALDMVQGSAD